MAGPEDTGASRAQHPSGRTTGTRGERKLGNLVAAGAAAHATGARRRTHAAAPLGGICRRAGLICGASPWVAQPRLPV